MNIFQALYEGNGKATLPEVPLICAFMENRGVYILWNEDTGLPFKVVIEDLRRNDWVPYIPHKKVKHKETFTNITQISHSEYGTTFPEIKMENNKGAKQNIVVTVAWETD